MNPFDFAELRALFREHLFPAICSVVSLVLAATIWILWQEGNSLTILNRERSREGETMLSTLVSGPLVRQELAHAHETVQRLEQNLINETDLAENYGYFYKLEEQSKARLSAGGLRQMGTDPAYDGSDYAPIPFILQLTGTYQEVATYLLLLETGPKLIMIKSFSLRRRESGSDVVTLNLEVRLLGKR